MSCMLHVQLTATAPHVYVTSSHVLRDVNTVREKDQNSCQTMVHTYRKAGLARRGQHD